jgi:2-aminoethylphosphonate transport system permease protein
VWGVTVVVAVVVFGLPLATIAIAGLSSQWSGALPSGLTFSRLLNALSGNDLASLSVSLQTAAAASGVSMVVGSWAAMAVRSLPRGARGALDAAFLLPIAVPSVVLGLGVLTAFNTVLSGTAMIVIVAHVALVLPFTYASVSAGLDRLDPLLAAVAASLGASPATVLRRITLPLLAPSLLASGGLAFALSMGELGATSFVYPPTWQTLPVTIQALTARGGVLQASAAAVVLLVTTLLVLVGLSLVRTRASYR